MTGARLKFRGNSPFRRSRGAGDERNLCQARGEWAEEVFRVSLARGGERTVPGAGAERVLPLKESKKRSFPRPRGGQDAFRGKAFGGSAVFPRRFCVKGRVVSPRRALRGSAGGGFPGFADSTTWDRSAPAPGTVRNPAPRGCDSLRYHDTTIARHACGNFRSRPARAETCNIR